MVAVVDEEPLQESSYSYQYNHLTNPNVQMTAEGQNYTALDNGTVRNYGENAS